MFSNKYPPLDSTRLRGSSCIAVETCKPVLHGILWKPYFRFVQRPLSLACVTAYSGILPTSTTSFFRNSVKRHPLKKVFQGGNLRIHFLENFSLAETTLFIGVPIEENHYKYCTLTFSTFPYYKNSIKRPKSSGIPLVFTCQIIPSLYSL